MAEPLIPNITDKILTSFQREWCNRIATLYNGGGKSFWWIYNNTLLPYKGDSSFNDLLFCLNYVRRIVIYELYPDLNYTGAKSGIEIPYWNGYNGMFPTWQISSEATGMRLIPWLWKNSNYMLRGNKWPGEMFFAPMLPLTPNDQKAFKAGGKRATRFALRDANIVEQNGIYYYEMLNHDLAFAYSMQYVFDMLFAEPINLIMPTKKTGNMPVGIIFFQVCFSYDNNVGDAIKQFNKLNFFDLSDLYKVTIFEKIVGIAQIVGAVVIAVVSAGAGTPILAAAITALTGKIIKQGTDLITGGKPPIPPPAPPPAPPAAPPDNEPINKNWLYAGVAVLLSLLLLKNKKR